MCDGLQTSLVLWGKGTENEPGVGVGGLPAWAMNGGGGGFWSGEGWLGRLSEGTGNIWNLWEWELGSEVTSN